WVEDSHPQAVKHDRHTRRCGREEHAPTAPWKTTEQVLCVQRRLARSAGVSPARVKARRPVAWIAGRRAIKDLKPIDNPIERMGASDRAAAQANADVASKSCSPEGPARETGVKAAWARHTLAVVSVRFGGVGSGGTVTRTRRAT